MKVSAALQLLTTVMSGTSSSSSPDDDCWSGGLPHQHVGQPPASLEFLLPRAELDLGACLDVETLEELPPAMPAMYTTPHSSSGPNPCPSPRPGPLYSGQALSAWVDNVIDMTSPPSELTSSGEHTITTSTTSSVSASSVGVVPSAGELSGGLSAGHQGFSAAVDNFDFNGFMEEEDFPGTDNATFLTMGDALTMSAAVAAIGGAGAGGADSSTTTAAAMDLADAEACSVLDFAQFGSLSSAALTSTTTTSTIDLTALEQFVTLDSADLTQTISSISNSSNINNNNINNNNTLEDSLGDLSNSNSNLNSNLSSNSNSISSNIPSTLWNMDLTLPVSEELEGVSSSGTCGRQQQHQHQQQGAEDVKVTLKNRLYSRGSLNSVSQDSDVIISSCSLRSPASSTSSLTQSLEDEDADDPVKMLEKREKNRLAAQKCRNRKRDKAETLQKNVTRLEERQEKLKEEVRKLRDERETLEEIVNIHSIVCPKIRKLSTTSADS